jgi:hypothetical protein
MKKIIIMLFVSVFLLSIAACISGCSDENNTEELDTLLQTKDDNSKGSSDEQQTIEDNTEESDDDIFVSVWPDELPKNEISEFSPDGGRPIQYKIEAEPGKWTVDFDYTSMYLYDFPDPEPVFHNFGNAFVHDIKAIYFKYDKLTSADGIDKKVAISRDDFDSFINAVIEAGYTDNSERTERTYYCEKYGVGITIALADVFPFADDDDRLRAYPTEADCCYVKLQLIDPDYVMDLEQIKAEEYQKWIEKHN